LFAMNRRIRAFTPKGETVSERQEMVRAARACSYSRPAR
jgi:hypothetical protein